MPQTTVRYHFPDGTVKAIHLRAKTKKELEQKKQELKIKEEKGINLAANCTFGYWAKQWLENTKLDQGLSKGTEDCYKACVNMLNQEFGDVEFRYLTMNRFQKYINQLAKKNPNTGKPVAASYLRKIKSTAKAVAQYANGSRVDGVSAFYNVTIPRSAKVEKRKALTEEQVKMIEDFEHPMQLFAMIATFSGLRRGEILALQWKHIDLKKSMIHVVQSLNWTPNQPVIKEGGKTENSARTVMIPPVLVSYLRKYRREQSVYPSPTAIVVANEQGRFFTSSEFRRRWKKYLADMNKAYGDFSNVDISGLSIDLPMKIEPFTPHQCRHFFATLCYLQGLSILDTMSELGHSNPQTTIAIYTDLKNYNKAELSEEFRQKLNTVYQIPISGIQSPVQQVLG